MNTKHKQACVVLGGGGHASVLIDALLSAGTELPVAILDSDESHWGQTVLGVPIEGDDRLLPELVKAGARYFIVGVGSTSTGDTHLRAKLFEQGIAQGLKPFSVVHPWMFVSAGAKIGPGVQLLPGCVVHTNAKLGTNVLINTRAIVEHDCIVEDHAHIATNACLCGGVRVGRRAHIGAGAVVRQQIEIGERAVVGAGAVVVKNVPADTVVAGVPARVLKRNDESRTSNPALPLAVPHKHESITSIS